MRGYPVSARPASPAYLLRKFVARHRWAVLAGALGGLGLATGLAAALLQGRAATALGVIGLAGGLAVALVQGRQAIVARDLAQSRLARTRAIASDVMVRHADSIHYLPGGLALKSDLLQNMITHLDRLAEQAGDDGSFAGELAMAYSRLADLQADNGLVSTNDGQAGEAHALKALALFEASAQACVDNPSHSVWWARAWRSRSLLAREQGDMPRAMQCIEQAVAIAGAGLRRHPDNTDLLADLGSAQLGRGQLLDSLAAANLNQPDAAMAAFAEAEAMYLRLQRVQGGTADDLITALHQLGTVAGARMLICAKQGRMEEAIEHGLRALDYRRETVRREPDHVGFRQALTTESNNLASCYLDIGEPQHALEWSTLARDMALELARADADNPERQWHVTFVGLHHGRSLRGVGRPAEALPLLQAVIDGGNGDAPAWLRRRVGRARFEQAAALRDLGRLDEALAAASASREEFERKAASAPDDIDGLLLLAQAQRLLHELAPTSEQQHWRTAFEASVARARSVATLNPLQERMAAWPA